MDLDWRVIDRWLMGEAWTGSQIGRHLVALCDEIGPRWSSSTGERQAVEYIRQKLEHAGLANATLEPYPVETWALDAHEAMLVEDGISIPILPCNRCPTFAVQAPLIDVGFGTLREIEAAGNDLPGAVAIMRLAQEQLDAMGDGLQCHVMSQLDTTSDHFPFLRAGLDAAHLWRWRFHGRHADANFHHEPGDTLDEVNVRE